MRTLLLALLLALTAAAQSTNVYKCQVGNITAYSERPCEEGGSMTYTIKVPKPSSTPAEIKQREEEMAQWRRSTGRWMANKQKRYIDEQKRKAAQYRAQAADERSRHETEAMIHRVMSKYQRPRRLHGPAVNPGYAASR